MYVNHGGGHRGRGGEKFEGVCRRHARDRPGAPVLAVIRCDAEGEGLSWRVGTVFGRMAGSDGTRIVRCWGVYRWQCVGMRGLPVVVYRCFG